MGREIERILLDRGHTVALRIDVDNTEELCANSIERAKVDMAIEFTAPGAAEGNVVRCIELGVPVVCGTTAWVERLPEVERLCKEKGGALFYSPNYSVGVNMLFALNRQLAQMMRGFGEYDVTVDEVHHTQKKDAPSGTAVVLARDIVDNCGRKSSWQLGVPAQGIIGPQVLEVTAQRRGDVAGIHTVVWESAADEITIEHRTKSRAGLAMGAVLAAEFLAAHRGTGRVYGMNDLLGF